MIAILSGTVAARNPPALVVDCAGVGYEVWAPMPVFDQIGEAGSAVRLFTHPIIREDSHSLYGFLTDEDRQFFRAMIKISGVGAKSALAIMSTATPAQVGAALQEGDPSLLVKTPGIGRKTAERIMVELKGMALAPGAPASSSQGDVGAALASLGFSQKEIRAALSKLPREDAGADLEQRIRACLRVLSK